MEGTYEVQLEMKTVGAVHVSRQGLYYQISCRCRPASGAMLELMVQGSGLQEKLGLLVPMDGGMGLDTKIPVKRLEGKTCFFLHPRGQKNDVWISVDPEKPFAHLQELDRAYLVERGGHLLIGLKKT